MTIQRTREEEAELQRRLSGFQAKYDEALAPMRRQAPAPRLGEGANAYRRRGLGFVQMFLPPDHDLHGLSLENCKADAIGVLEKQILHAARETARQPELLANTPAGRPDSLDPTLRAVTQANGVTTYHGESFVRAMGRPGRRVLSFMTEFGPTMTKW
jgi:hypothetical protein